MTKAATLAATAAGPAFSAGSSGTQSITTSTWTKVQLGTEIFDTNNNFDNVTNYRFTPTVAGYYQINGNIGFTSSSGATRIITAIYKNGTEFIRGNYMVPFANANGCSSAVGLIYLNGSTDYVELFGFMTATGPTMGGNSVETTFNGFLARAA